jgi:hypothetical protein
MKKILALCILMSCCYLSQAQENKDKDSTLQQYTGKYKFPDGSVVTEVTVTLENGGLIMTSAVGTSTLEKTGDDLFAITQFEGSALFKRDANKKIIGVSINAQGYSLEGTKSELTLQSLGLLQKRSLTLSLIKR